MIAVIGPVVMDVTRLLAFEGEVVRDASDTDYLYTKVRVSLEGIVGIGSGQSWTIINDPNVGPSPVQTYGATSAINSFVSLRHALSQRLPFCLFEPGLRKIDPPQILLFSTGTDCNNGPKPLESSVLSVHGGGLTAFVRYSVEIAINECPLSRSSELKGSPGVLIAPGNNPALALGLLNANGEPMLLSNRWQTGVNYDPEDQSVTYSLVGQATFRRDALDRFFATSPDEFRGALLPPPPLNCKRFIDEISVAPDGLTLQYQVRDVEQIRAFIDYDVNFDTVEQDLANPRFPLKHVAKVDVVVDKTYGQPGISKIFDHALDAFQRVLFANPISSGGGDLLGVQQGGKDLVKTGLSIALGALKTVDNLMPYYRESATARIQLKREGKLADAQFLAYALISGALNYGNGQSFFFNQGVGNFALLPPLEVSLKWSPTSAWLEATMTIERSGIVDMVSGNTSSGIGTMLNPISDTIIGGSVPYSLASIAGWFGAAPQRIINLLNRLGNKWAAQFKGGQQEDVIDPHDIRVMKSELGIGTLLGHDDFQYKLLVTPRNVRVVGPNGDFYSRSLSDVIVRAAAVLLRPCQTPQAAKAYQIPVDQPSSLPAPGQERKPEGQPPPRPAFPEQPLAKNAQDLVDQWAQGQKRIPPPERQKPFQFAELISQ